MDSWNHYEDHCYYCNPCDVVSRGKSALGDSVTLRTRTAQLLLDMLFVLHYWILFECEVVDAVVVLHFHRH